MPGPAAILKEIHRLRRHANSLQNEIDRGPRLLMGQQAKVARQQELLKEAQDAIKHLKVNIHEKEVTLKTTNQQIDKHQLQLNQASSKKEYDGLKVEIESDKKACGKIEDEILNQMTGVDEKTGQLADLEQAVRQAKEDSARFEKSQKDRHVDLADQLAKALSELKEVENSIPEMIRQDYDRLVGARGEDAMSAVAGRTCTACYTEITAQNYNELLQGQFVVCKSCGRILYLAE